MKVFEERGITHLDLHGTLHEEVEIEVLDFCYQFQHNIPLMIICGNSNKMIALVSQALRTKSIKFTSKRYGLIRVESL